MTPGAKLGAYALVLAAAFGGGATAGWAIGPIDLGTPSTHEQEHPSPPSAPDTDRATNRPGVDRPHD